MGVKVSGVLVERVAALVRWMTPAQRARLLDLSPRLRRDALTGAEARESTGDYFERRVAEVLHTPFRDDTGAPFLGPYTLDEFCRLPEDEQIRLWDQAHAQVEEALNNCEYPVRTDAMPAR